MNVSKISQSFQELAKDATKKVDIDKLTASVKASMKGLDLQKLKGISSDEFQKVAEKIKTTSFDSLVKPAGKQLNKESLQNLVKNSGITTKIKESKLPAEVMQQIDKTVSKQGEAFMRMIKK